MCYSLIRLTTHSIPFKGKIFWQVVCFVCGGVKIVWYAVCALRMDIIKNGRLKKMVTKKNRWKYPKSWPTLMYTIRTPNWRSGETSRKFLHCPNPWFRSTMMAYRCGRVDMYISETVVRKPGDPTCTHYDYPLLLAQAPAWVYYRFVASMSLIWALTSGSYWWYMSDRVKWLVIRGR